LSFSFLSFREEDSSGRTMRYQEELIERTFTRRKVRRGRWMNTLPHRIDGELVCRGTNTKFLSRYVEIEKRYESRPMLPRRYWEDEGYRTGMLSSI
jgi:hypothetical protein